MYDEAVFSFSPMSTSAQSPRRPTRAMNFTVIGSVPAFGTSGASSPANAPSTSLNRFDPLSTQLKSLNPPRAVAAATAKAADTRRSRFIFIIRKKKLNPLRHVLHQFQQHAAGA